MTAFYDLQRLGPVDATPSQKLDAVAAHLAAYIVRRVKDASIVAGEAGLIAEAEANYGVD